MTAPLNESRKPRYVAVGATLWVIVAMVLGLVFLQFRGDLTPKTQLTMLANRAGLVMDPGARVAYNGVEIGKVGRIESVDVDGKADAKFTLEVHPKYIELIPANVQAKIVATTVFGNKYVSLTSPENPAAQSISSRDVIDATHVTTELNTLFETVVSIMEKVDPIKLNTTLTATAQALDGLGERFGQSIVDGNVILADLNPRMPQIRYDIQRLGDLADVYTNASPDLWDFLDNAVTTARTLNEQQNSLDSALLASIGFGNTTAPIFEEAGPYLVRGVEDLITTSEVLDRNSPALVCWLRAMSDLQEPGLKVLSGNGYAFQAGSSIAGALNPYVYPDNLPRVNARGGPAGRPGCWQNTTRDLWPAPMIVMDTGASAAPYNHFEIGQPILAEYVWGRQVGEYTINP
ncbi:MCE family protein [Mycobacterium sp. smrl_JER01]|uniref:MCE family protein n=1 Tax=Mycobacterium sp. smrl_JER01 TaxID=3402633 RepID=UPI003ABE7B28